MFIFWAFWILVAALAFKDSIDCGRCRLTDKQQKELDALYDKGGKALSVPEPLQYPCDIFLCRLGC